ncbi:armadillo repeat-containing protein 10 isoform 2-T2 [Rhinophrynus dorsalis]
MKTGVRMITLRSLLGLALGAGLCYYVYRMVFPKERRKRKSTAGKEEGKPSSILERVSGIPLVPSVHSTAATKTETVPTSASNLEPHHLKKLLDVFATSTDSSLREQILITLGNSAAFSVNQDIIRELGGITLIGEALSDSNPQLKAKALNALNNLSMNIQNQELIKDYIGEICKDISSFPLNSEVQLAGLRLLVNMSVTNNYHDMMANYIPSFLCLLAEGNNITQTHTLKVLVNLSANPSVTRCLLSSKAQWSLTSLFDSCVNRDILVRALTLAANLSEHLRKEQDCEGHTYYSEDSLFALLFGNSAPLQKNLTSLSRYPDMEIKEQVSRLLINEHKLKGV